MVIARFKMDNDWEIPFNQRRRKRYNEQLDKVLKQYSITKVEGKCIHGKDYREMKKLILDTINDNNDEF